VRFPGNALSDRDLRSLCWRRQNDHRRDAGNGQHNRALRTVINHRGISRRDALSQGHRLPQVREKVENAEHAARREGHEQAHNHHQPQGAAPAGRKVLLKNKLNQQDQQHKDRCLE